MVNVAVIGLGNMGKHHARIYSKLGLLRAVCDINQDLAGNIANKFGCKAYLDYKEMLDKEEITAVSIVVPTKFHKEIGLYCINRNIDVLIEKPIAANVSDAEAIIAKANEKKVMLQVGHIERFNPAVQKLKQIIGEGKLGEITSIIARRVGTVPVQIRDTNVVIDMAVHDIDIINYLFEGYPDKIIGNKGKAIIERREDYAEILLKYGDKLGFIQVNWITPVKIRNLAVTGSKGYAELDYISQKLTVYESNYTNEGKDEYGDYVIKFNDPSKIVYEIENKEPLFLELSDFIKCVKLREMPLVTGEIGLNALKIALQVMDDG